MKEGQCEHVHLLLVFSSPAQGCIRALQPRELESAQQGDDVEVQTSWIAVANVSFADMLCSVDKAKESPRRARAARPASTSAALRVPCDDSEALTPHSLAKPELMVLKLCSVYVSSWPLESML
jgi:hypothetical protein